MELSTVKKKIDKPFKALIVIKNLNESVDSVKDEDEDIN